MIVKNIGEKFSFLELQGETSRVNNGVTITVYHSDEPTPAPVIEVPLPNWLGLEQSLVYSGLFNRARSYAHSNGFTVFVGTLQNGKRGEATEGFLSMAFAGLEMNWTTEEVDEINGYLTANNFTIQIT